MAKTLIFDLGGVLMEHDIPGCMDRFKKLMGDNFSKLGLGADGEGTALMKQYELGLVGTDEFIASVLEWCVPGTSAADIAEAWNSMHAGIPSERIECLKALKSLGFRLGLISNINDLHWKNVLDSVPGFGDIFDFKILSFEEHQAKPDKNIFLKAWKKAGCKAHEIIFVDDLKENRDAAGSMGIKTYESILDMLQFI